MDLSALPARALARLVEDLRSLVRDGQASSAPLAELAAPGSAGLWAGDGARLVARPALVALGDRLPGPGEVPAAALALVPEVRAAWRRVALARLRELGERRDVAALADAVTQVGPLAAELAQGVEPSLAATAFSALERLVLPGPATEAQAYPALLRALVATSDLARARSTTPAPPPDVIWDDPAVSWRPGRLLRLPSSEDQAPATAVLTGALDAVPDEAEVMGWALRRPWAFLLGQVAFTKEAWEAERVSGGLALELEGTLAPSFECPPRVDVVVTLPSGEEVRCGTLGELVLQTLGRLGVVLLGHRVTAETLDAQLALAVEAVLRRDVWRFDHGTGGRRPGYSIHPAFSDACYRRLGSRAFYRRGSHVTAAIRAVAEAWARERMARAGVEVA